MTEMLILYILLERQSTMYGLGKSIKQYFGSITTPGLGTIQPALKRLEKQEYIKADKFFTEGGKPYYYYSITNDGKNALITEILSKPSTNPVQLLPAAKLKLICSNILDNREKKELCNTLKTEILKVYNHAEKTIKSDYFANNYSAKIVMNNLLCEYKNTLDMIEGLKNVGNS